MLFAATSGDVLVVRERRAVELQQSQMWLTDLTVEGAVAFNDGNEFATIRIPRRELLAICPDAESRLAEPLVASPGIRDVIARYYRSGGRRGHIAGPDRPANDGAAHG